MKCLKKITQQNCNIAYNYSSYILRNEKSDLVTIYVMLNQLNETWRGKQLGIGKRLKLYVILTLAELQSYLTELRFLVLKCDYEK